MTLRCCGQPTRWRPLQTPRGVAVPLVRPVVAEARLADGLRLGRLFESIDLIRLPPGLFLPGLVVLFSEFCGGPR